MSRIVSDHGPNDDNAALANGDAHLRKGGNGLDAEEPCPPTFSDEALALHFAEIHAGDLRHVAAWNKWLSWDGTRWLFDTRLATWNEARKICRAAAAECDTLKLAAALASSKKVAAVIGLARCDPRLAATAEQWNTDIWSAKAELLAGAGDR